MILILAIIVAFILGFIMGYGFLHRLIEREGYTIVYDERKKSGMGKYRIFKS